MKLKLSIFSLVFATLLTFQAGNATYAAKGGGQSAPGPLGVGIMLGEPSGLNVKYWLNRENALNFGLAYSFGSYLDLIGDWDWHFPGAISTKGNYTLTPYVGVGANLAFQSAGRYTTGLYLGVRIPVGIEFRPNQPNIGVFFI